MEAAIVCLIDDDEVYQYTTTRNIKESNLAKHILVFPDGEKALDYFVANIGNSEKLPEVIFLDINMPYMDGWQFLEEFVKLKPTLPKKATIYLVTSSASPNDLKRAKEIEEISDYYIKPITKDVLQNSITQAIADSIERINREEEE